MKFVLIYFLFGFLLGTFNFLLTMYQIHFKKPSKPSAKADKEALGRIAYLLLPAKTRIMVNIKIFLIFFFFGFIIKLIHVLFGWTKAMRKESK